MWHILFIWPSPTPVKQSPNFDCLTINSNNCTDSNLGRIGTSLSLVSVVYIHCSIFRLWMCSTCLSHDLSPLGRSREPDEMWYQNNRHLLTHLHRRNSVILHLILKLGTSSFALWIGFVVFRARFAGKLKLLETRLPTSDRFEPNIGTLHHTHHQHIINWFFWNFHPLFFYGINSFFYRSSQTGLSQLPRSELTLSGLSSMHFHSPNLFLIFAVIKSLQRLYSRFEAL